MRQTSLWAKELEIQLLDPEIYSINIIPSLWNGFELGQMQLASCA